MLVADCVVATLLTLIVLTGCGGSQIGQSQTSAPKSASLTSIAIGQGSPSILPGQSEQFTATGVFSDGSKQDLTAKVVWSSSQPAIATIASSGMAIAVAPGAATISATSGPVSNSARLTVMSPPPPAPPQPPAPVTLLSIAVTTASPSIQLGLTQQFSAMGSFSDGSTQNLTNSASWSSSPAGIVGIDGSGLATAVGIGNATVTASSRSVSGTTTVAVSAPDGVGLLKVVNDGSQGDTPATGNLCDLIYVFSNEQLLECCGCVVTPNGSRDYDVRKHLLANTLTGQNPTEVVLQQVSSGPAGASVDFDATTCVGNPDGSVSCPTSGACDPTNAAPLPGLHGWLTQVQTVAGMVGVTEHDVQFPDLGNGLMDLSEDCRALIELGSGRGLCTCGTSD